MGKYNKFLILYYLALLMVMVSWTDTEQAPNIALRLMFLFAVVIPPAIVDKSFLAPAVICFMAITQNGFAHSYMPETLWYYVVLLFVMFLVLRPFHNFKMPTYIWVAFLYVAVVDLITGFAVEKITMTFVVGALLTTFASRHSEKDINLWSMGFVMMSLVLSSLFLLNRDKFAEAYYSQGLERTTWMDPNYFGMVIGMGTVIALLELVGRKDNIVRLKYQTLIKAIYIATVLLSLLTLVLNASRGALLATGAVAIFAIMFSGGKTYLKLISIITILIGIVFIYYNSYYDLLVYRMENENTEGGNGRVVLWTKKLYAYLDGDFASIIFGNGYQGGLQLGFSNKCGTHNDYLSFLIEYGIIGFIMFINMLIRPIIHAFRHKSKQFNVTMLMLYLAICCFTIEPITGAYVPDLFFYLYILLIAYSGVGDMTPNRVIKNHI